MCNENKTHNEDDYRFLDYRLNQYELKLDKGLEKLEQSQQNNYIEIMKTLQIMQEGQNEQNKTIIELTQKQLILEKRTDMIEGIELNINSHAEKIRTIFDRLNTYKQLLTGVGITAIAAIIVEIIKFI